MPGSTEKKEPMRSSSSLDSKPNIPYPSFSKAHSKESVGSRENIRPNPNIFTPDPTDLNVQKPKDGLVQPATTANAPPSPPLTSVDDKSAHRTTTRVRSRPEVETIVEEKTSVVNELLKERLRPKSTRSAGDLKSRTDVGRSPSPPKPKSKPGTPIKIRIQADSKAQQRSTSQPLRPKSPAHSAISAAETSTQASSDATSVAPNQPSNQRPVSRSEIISPATGLSNNLNGQHSSPQTSQSPHVVPFHTGQNLPFIQDGLPPPPPPPPPTVPTTVPRVDYLLQNGGLSHNLPKTLLSAGRSITQRTIFSSNPDVAVANIFEPFSKLLDDYNYVMEKNGSVAVATGYRSVARRLLDRLEAVFARDISSVECQCCMCRPNESTEDVTGVSWGEILELVSGRRELPYWPPFTFIASPMGLGISLENHIPMQKLDIDVPEEWREHYLKQSKRTKQTVDKWLARQVEGPSSPPAEVDDDTLTFAILTHLVPHQRPAFTGLLGIVSTPIEPPRRAPSPNRGQMPQASPSMVNLRPRPEPILQASQAITRLYRLSTLPRDPETAIYMLNNPSLHNTLATLAEINEDEWDILTSGRFDGFLRSGAEEELSHPTRSSPFRPASARQATPLDADGRTSAPPRPATTSQTPAQYGAPIAFDEETEISTLAEIEREVYLGMEALEDAFEALHVKAEAVRRALRERNVGLTYASQRRRGCQTGIEVRTDTPASGIGDRWEGETDDGFGDWDGTSELAPDDSASNISSSRRRRPKRRNERRTPALVEEEEEDITSEGTASPEKR